MWAILDTHKDIIFGGNVSFVETTRIIFYAWWKQFLCLIIILFGVYMANRTQRDDA